MRNKPPSHKPIAIKIEDYNYIQAIAEQIMKEKGIPISLPNTVHAILERWKDAGIKV